MRSRARRFSGRHRLACVAAGENRPFARAPPRARRTCAAGTVAEIGYRGDRSIYNVRLAGRLCSMRAAMPNTGPRLDLSIGDAVWLFWAPGCRRGADAMSATAHEASDCDVALVAAVPYLWLLAFFLAPFADRAEDQPVADRDGAAALHAGVRSLGGLAGIAGFRRAAFARELMR